MAIGLALSVVLPIAAAAAASDSSEQVLLERAKHWQAQNRPDLAADALDKALAIDPGQPDALFQAGMLAVQQGDLKKAQQYFDRLRQQALAGKNKAEAKRAIAQTTPTQPETAMTIANVSAASPPLAAPPAVVASTPPLPAQTVAPPLQGPTYVFPGVELQFAPRFWYLFGTSGAPRPSTTPQMANLTLGPEPATFTTRTNTDFEFPMGGFAGSARFAELPDTTFVLTAFYGKTSFIDTQSTTVLGPVPTGQPMGTLFEKIRTNVNRYDLELLGQTNITQTPGGSSLGWILGARWEHEPFAQSITPFDPINRGSTPLSSFPFLAAIGFNVKDISGHGDVYIGKAGLAGAVPLNSDSTLRLFGNIMILAGAFDFKGGRVGIAGPDMSVGIQYQLAPDVVADLRYRGMFEFFFSTPAGFADYAINQGPMIGINFKF